MIRVSLPARINVVGSPTDACEGAYATITAAIERRGGAEIADTAAPAGASNEIEDAAVTALCRYVPGLADAMVARPSVIRTWTYVPATSGLGGSSVLLLAVLAALRAFYALDPRRWNDYVLAEIAQRAEEGDLGVVCGFADRYAPLFGGVAYLSYHGKLWHAPLGEEPYATYERLDNAAPALSFVVATSGISRNSGAIHEPMRARYLDERRRGNGRLLVLARSMGETAWRSKIALLAHDLAELGRQIDRNQELIDEMMTACGFAGGAGAEVRDLIAAARRAGALGAKLTGAGAGGAVFALPPPGQAEQIADALRAHAARSGLKSEVFVAPVATAGLRVDQ